MINGMQTDMISVRDRGLQYGDGCFETILVRDRTPILLQEHLHRLARTCRLLQIDYDEKLLINEFGSFVTTCPGLGVVKIIITRGSGGRGYAASATTAATRILMYSDLPADYLDKRNTGIVIGIADIRLSESAVLGGLKHLNRLDQVLASFSLTPDTDEVLCLDVNDNVIEGTKSNIVLVSNDAVVTPSLVTAGVKGVMLDYLQRRFSADQLSIEARPVSLHEIYTASEVFMCNSVFGVWPVRKIVGNAKFHQWPTGPITNQALRYQDELFGPAL